MKGVTLLRRLDIGYSSKRKKQRGQKRRLKVLIDNMQYFTPFENVSWRYIKFGVPGDPFISLPKTSGKIKTEFCRAWLEKTAEIIRQKPDDIGFCKVVASINENDLWQSKITIFYDEEYYDCFWNRDVEYQTWEPIDESSVVSFVKKHNIKTSLKEKAYLETIVDEEDGNKKSMLWFYGEI